MRYFWNKTIFYDSFPFSQHASFAVSVCGSSAVLRCVSSLSTSTLQGQISGCTRLTSNQSNSSSSSKYSSPWGSNWDKCMQNGTFTPSLLRRSSEGGAQKQTLSGSVQCKSATWAKNWDKSDLLFPCYQFSTDFLRKMTLFCFIRLHNDSNRQGRLYFSHMCQWEWAAGYQGTDAKLGITLNRRKAISVGNQSRDKIRPAF